VMSAVKTSKTKPPPRTTSAVIPFLIDSKHLDLSFRLHFDIF
jgi:hypothetical protein